MELVDILRRAVELGGSDIFVVPGSSVMVKVDNNMVPLTQEKLLPKDTEALVGCMYEIARRDYNLLERDGDDDFSFAILDVSRFRCNVVAHDRSPQTPSAPRIVSITLIA